MKNDGENIDYNKLAAYIAGEGSAAEREAMQRWIDASEDNRKIYEQYKKVFQLDYMIDPPTEDSIDEAVVFNTDNAWSKVAQKAGLVTGQDKTITLPVDPVAGHKGKGTSFPWLKIAASVVIGLTLVFYLVNRQVSKEVAVNFEEGINEYYFPDSTRVVLNGASRLVFNKDFNHNHRTVQMEGKAYFDVVRNENLPFIVMTKDGQVTVLGTAFLVEENIDNMTVEVERGKVSLSSPRSATPSSIVLRPNEQGILDIEKNILSKTKLSSLNHLYWANRKLTYRQAPLQQVLEDLAVIFEKKILYNPDAIFDCRVSAVFNDQKFEDILQNLSVVMGFEYIISENQIEITSNGCNAN